MPSPRKLLAAMQGAAAALHGGGLVAFPTETVYGLGADAENPAAVARIFAAKGRPADHPLIVHIANPDQLTHWAKDIPPAAWLLARRCWPGPLTLILRRACRVPDIVTGGQDTVGLRVPDHPLALALIEASGGGIAAPSANRFGRVSPTTAAHVREELGAAMDFILDGGPCRVGIESTILDLSGHQPRLLRPGAITIAGIEAVLGQPIAQPGSHAPRAPGMLRSHYAPKTPVCLVPAAHLEAEARRRLAQGQRVAALTMSATLLPEACLRQDMPTHQTGWARELYARLRAVDAQGSDCILIEEPPIGADWQAVRDRLERAASAHGASGEFLSMGRQPF
ncbi:L-threonylcarbamoyladenylate synthase [Acidithiobacillus sulfuriphilus]|uniref:Threonylcarbamoyl-AMP synthase n=2 Tax=Acidithiobacillus sulfuriphilus TaxID=1867749 RepID=A0A3M8RMJ4_9PROT|nr:L-threonylcarbamoyladenylate synthase [Acidithiobacillus sulfuriphilus]RNF69848.1 threonylcarbamoyl-AMP synthase [Acidithiobacillus sulfuriphilus]